MEWYVYRRDCMLGRIEKYNILTNQDTLIKKLVKKGKTIEAFSELLRSEMKYHYWARYEWELVIKKDAGRILLTPLPPVNDEAKIVDVTNDPMLEWSSFYDKLSETYRVFKEGIKFDVYEQLNARWDEYVEYCWSCSHAKKKRTQAKASEQQEMDLITEKMQKGEYRVFSNVEELIDHLEKKK